MSTIAFNLDEDAVTAAITNHLKTNLGMDLTGKNVSVAFTTQRKTAANPYPKSSAIVTVVDTALAKEEKQLDNELSPEDSVVPAEATVEEVTESAEVDELGLPINDDDFPSSEVDLADDFSDLDVEDDLGL